MSIQLRSFIVLVILAISSAMVLPMASAKAEQTYPYAKWIMPSGKPKAVVIVIHGGSWWGQNENLVNSMVPMAQHFSKKSQAVTMNIDYHSGRQSLPDVVAMYDLARQKFPNLPICAAGSSAGGNLALLLAQQRPVNCVISEAGPTDIATTEASVRGSAEFLLGKENLRAWSPLYTTGRIKVPTMLVSATNDDLVPHKTQAVPFKKKYPKATLITLRPGDQNANLVHSNVDSAQFNKARSREAALVTNVAKKYEAAKQKAAQKKAAQKKAAQKRAAQQQNR